MTPVVGVRVGVSLTRGNWEQAGETPLANEARASTIATVEADLSYRHTRLQAEWTRDRFSVIDGEVIARGWFVQGAHTISPRWFVAGRIERLEAPAIIGTGPSGIIRQNQHFQGFEETLGYRLTPELTLRGSHRMREVFGRTETDHVGAVSIVWWRRWK